MEAGKRKRAHLMGSISSSDVVREFAELCGSDSLTHERLDEKIASFPSIISPSAIQGSSFLHRACRNRNVTLGMVESLLEFWPAAAAAPSEEFCPNDEEEEGKTRAYPLHLACLNPRCPSTVIELLVDRYSVALRHPCIIDEDFPVYFGNKYLKGLPLHYYLSRSSSNIDRDIVKVLVEGDPETLAAAAGGDIDTTCSPLHFFLNQSSIGRLDVVRYLIERTEPSTALRVVDARGRSSLHIACSNEKEVIPEVVSLLLKHCRGLVYYEDLNGRLPIHNLCENERLGDCVAVEILNSLVRGDTAIAIASDDDGYLPIHLAAENAAICRRLIDLHPDSVMARGAGNLPIHEACQWGSLETVKVLLEHYPEGIYATNSRMFYPIHEAAVGQSLEKADILKFLLLHDPAGASKFVLGPGFDQGSLPLHLACSCTHDLEAVKALFESYPESIYLRDRRGYTPTAVATNYAEANHDEGETEVTTFLKRQQAYANQANDVSAMMSPDHNSQLPLHHALVFGNDISIGTIKLLVKANPAAVQAIDRRGRYPFHLACESGTVDTLQYLAGCFDGCLSAHDEKGNYPLHYSCRGANVSAIAYLLGTKMSKVSERNADGKLPIQLLCESGEEKAANDTLEYVEAIWGLLVAHPETVSSW